MYSLYFERSYRPSTFSMDTKLKSHLPIFRLPYKETESERCSFLKPVIDLQS
ncbi:hypothetical protein LEP1GSC017_2302 [Leptospira meyeri serovar Hardjo str. Went 5]|nr:hypothetical protein LEP1GSC017_2302 [Leptospira meyeri serovar Hardjo str. Went 5]